MKRELDTLVFVDVETTGVDPATDEVIEVAMVGLAGESVTFSLAFDETTANPKALEINGWGSRPFPPQRTAWYAADQILGWFGWEPDDEPDHRDNPVTWSRDRKVGFVGKHAHFDAAFLTSFLKRAGAPEVAPWTKYVYDLPSLACGRLGISPTICSSGALERHFSLYPQRTHRDDGDPYHTALADAEWNRDLYLALNLWHA